MEKERRDREEAMRLEQVRFERERRETEKRAAEKRAREEAEREKLRIAAEKAAKERARQEAERKAALKQAEEEQARLEAEKRKEAQRAEEAKRQKVIDEQNRARNEQGEAETRAAALRSKRIEALSAFEEVCDLNVAAAFVRKVSGIIDKEMPSEICVRFRPLTRQSTLSQEKKLDAAVELTRDVKLVVVKLVEYAKEYLKDVEEQLTDPLTTSEYRKELKDVPRKIEEFLGHAEIIVNGDPANPEVQFKCIRMIHSVPHWF